MEKKSNDVKTKFWKFSLCFKNYIKGTNKLHCGRQRIESEISDNEIFNHLKFKNEE